MNNKSKDLKKRLWKAADALRGNISSENYMHIVIGIMFLKHLSDNQDLKIKEYYEKTGIKIDTDDLDDLATAKLSFIIPPKTRWEYISQFATESKIGEILDNAFEKLESKNKVLEGLFDKNYNREELDQWRLGKVVSEFSNVNLEETGKDFIGETYEYFLGEFFKKQGQKGGEFYTPKCIVNLMVQIINPKEGKIYDPAAGTGGMFVQSRDYIIANNDNPDRLVPYGQEYQNKTWKLSRINLLLNGFFAGNIYLGAKSADTFTNDQHKGKKFEYVLANPPFNLKNWGLEELQHDERWKKLGMPPKNNANYAWLSHMIYKLNDNGRGATVLANGSLSGFSKEELNIRKNLIKYNLLEAIISLPSKLFYTTGIPVCIWVFNKNKVNDQFLMINAQDLKGEMISKKLRKLTEKDISKIVQIYNDFNNTKSINEVGFAKSVSKNEIEENDYSFVPGRYVGFVEENIDKDKIKKEIKQDAKKLQKLFQEFQELIPQVNDSISKVLEFEDKDKK